MATPLRTSETPVWPPLLLVPGIWVLASSLLQPCVCQCCKPLYTILTCALRLDTQSQLLLVISGLAFFLRMVAMCVPTLLIPQLFMDSVALFNSSLLALQFLLKLESFSLLLCFSAKQSCSPPFLPPILWPGFPQITSLISYLWCCPLLLQTSANLSLEPLFFLVSSWYCKSKPISGYIWAHILCH